MEGFLHIRLELATELTYGRHSCPFETWVFAAHVRKDEPKDLLNVVSKLIMTAFGDQAKRKQSGVLADPVPAIHIEWDELQDHWEDEISL
jgi:hypothetical protein